jgi:hypothetical protein
MIAGGKRVTELGEVLTGCIASKNYRNYFVDLTAYPLIIYITKAKVFPN